MAKPFGAFAQDIAQLAITVEQNAGLILRRVALAADQALVLATPVDTGRARANWLMSIGEPIVSPRDAYSAGQKGSTAAENTAAALEQAKKALAGYRVGFPIVLSNNVDYIDDLNKGKSAQAPALFIQRALQAAVAAFESSGISLTLRGA